MLYKRLFCFIMLTSIAFFTGCDDEDDNDTTPDDNGKKEVPTYAISQIKTGNVEPGDTVKVKGTYVLPGSEIDAHHQPFIVDSGQKVMTNASLPEESYVRFERSSAREYMQEVETGQIIELTGVVKKFENKEDFKVSEMKGPEYLTGLKPTQPPRLTGKSKIDFSEFEYKEPCVTHPIVCEQIQDILPSKFALLYSGGISAGSNYQRYWNDLKFMYLTLVNKYGYKPENIQVVYAAGNPEDSKMPVDYAATNNGLNNAFSDLQSRVGNGDKLFVFTTNHGGGYLTSQYSQFTSYSPGNFRGSRDFDGDENDANSIDETMFFYNASDVLEDDEFVKQLDQLNPETMIIVLEPCFSGGFIADLSDNDRIVVSAAVENEFSWSYTGGAYDAFAYHFTAALNGNDPNGNQVNADQNNDGEVSILEAFQYANNNDSRPESPQYDDNGDGTSTGSPTANGNDGAFGSNVTP